jgi:hypothetical protein
MEKQDSRARPVDLMRALEATRCDKELDAAYERLVVLGAQVKAAFADYSAAIKRAAEANWSDDLTDAAERFRDAAKQADADMSAEVARVEDYLQAVHGLSLEQLEKETRQRLDSRFWKAQLSPATMEPTALIEYSLDLGLDAVLTRVPAKWLKEQYIACQRELERRNAMPFILVGSARHKPVIGPHPFAYALFLTDLFRNKRPEIEVYDSAFFIPVIAALCDRMNGITAVKGGERKLAEMLRAPAGEFEGRIYELLVAGRAAEKGRDVEFIKPGNKPTPDLRINDLYIPVTIECKFQARWSETERVEIEVIDALFGELSNKYAKTGMAVVVELTFTRRIRDIGYEEVLEDVSKQLDSLIPFGERSCSWGTVRTLPIAPEVEWNELVRLYSPAFLSQVFQWNPESPEWDGICASVVDARDLVTQRARRPIGMKWRLHNAEDEMAKARDVMRSLSEAANQIPVGEAGCLYVGFEDSHRSALADIRTRRIIEKLPNFWHRKRGAAIQFLLVTRLYPRPIGDGRPDMVESCVPASVQGVETWLDLMPTTVFVPETG